MMCHQRHELKVLNLSLFEFIQDGITHSKKHNKVMRSTPPHAVPEVSVQNIAFELESSKMMFVGLTMAHSHPFEAHRGAVSLHTV